MIGKIISWNVRGINDGKKHRIIMGCLKRWKPDLICLQEIKTEEINLQIIRNLWNGSKVDWVFLPADGAARGILIMWDKEKFICRGVERGRVSLLGLFENWGNGKNWAFSSVY